MSKTVKYYGSCHCGAVRWSCLGPEEIQAISCNCSICYKKQNNHFIVNLAHFELLQGDEELTTYQFNKKIAQHKFCKICGVQSFYHPRSNPGTVAIMPHCIDTPQIKKLTLQPYDGQNWEQEMSRRVPAVFDAED